MGKASNNVSRQRNTQPMVCSWSVSSFVNKYRSLKVRQSPSTVRGELAFLGYPSLSRKITLPDDCFRRIINQFWTTVFQILSIMSGMCTIHLDIAICPCQNPRTHSMLFSYYPTYSRRAFVPTHSKSSTQRYKPCPLQ
jgi:hypothetical protein